MIIMAKSFYDQWKIQRQKIGVNLYKAGKAVEFKAKELVAVKTGALREDIATRPVKYFGGGWEVSIGNQSVYYAVYVHEPVMNQTRNYRRFGSIVYSGKGQKYLTRAVEEIGIAKLKSIIFYG